VTQKPSSVVSGRPIGLEETLVPSSALVRYLYQPGELAGGRQRATDSVWSLTTHTVRNAVRQAGQPALYYLNDGPARRFVREELLVVPPGTDLYLIGFSLTQQLVKKLLYCCHIFAGCEVMTKRPCCCAVCRDPFFRVQWTQACLILLVDSHLMTAAPNNNLFVLHLFMLMHTLLVAQVFLYNGFLNALCFPDVVPVILTDRIHLWAQAQKLAYGSVIALVLELAYNLRFLCYGLGGL